MKKYKIQNNIGTAKYVVSYCSGKKHKDKSDLYDVKILSSKKKLSTFIKSLESKNYKLKK